MVIQVNERNIMVKYLDSYKDAPWSDDNIVHEGPNVIIYKDGYPVTEGHLLFVPKIVECRRDITRCFEIAYEWGVQGVCDYKWTAFNIGINNGVEAGQSIMWPHVHLIPRRKGDVKDPKRLKGGVRHVVPLKGYYDEEMYGEEADWKESYRKYAMYSQS